jgi:hypothetical protein
MGVSMAAEGDHRQAPVVKTDGVRQGRPPTDVDDTVSIENHSACGRAGEGRTRARAQVEGRPRHLKRWTRPLGCTATVGTQAAARTESMVCFGVEFGGNGVPPS